ncbi:hypothetical protein SDC9_59883 [bioreactor metagenome]|uniref:Uncharacterized protein n=1 Tax=bioreactor metagenome TaxID=1076179 RepID=A0A644XBD5_9ZZZZ
MFTAIEYAVCVKTTDTIETARRAVNAAYPCFLIERLFLKTTMLVM